MARILIACEYSGVVREAFRRRGHEVVSCDLLPSDDNSPCHIQGDIIEILKYNPVWDLMIAHPPCTFLTNSGVRWLHEREGRWDEMRAGAEFFKKLMNQPNISRIAVENPIPHKYALEIIGRKYDQIIQPWQFGHGETKATCLWLKNLPRLVPTKIVEGRVGYVHSLPPSKDRWKLRSRTYEGIAEAMVEQWSPLLRKSNSYY